MVLKDNCISEWKKHDLRMWLVMQQLCNVHLPPSLQDTAGSERYESMSRIYYRGAKAAIVCFGKAAVGSRGGQTNLPSAVLSKLTLTLLSTTYYLITLDDLCLLSTAVLVFYWEVIQHDVLLHC